MQLKSSQLSNYQRTAIFIDHLTRFRETMIEERRKRGHIVYPEGVMINPSVWPACPPDCDHVEQSFNTLPH